MDNEKRDYFFATLDVHLMYGEPPEEAMVRTVADYAEVFHPDRKTSRRSDSTGPEPWAVYVPVSPAVSDAEIDIKVASGKFHVKPGFAEHISCCRSWSQAAKGAFGDIVIGQEDTQNGKQYFINGQPDLGLKYTINYCPFCGEKCDVYSYLDLHARMLDAS